MKVGIVGFGYVGQGMYHIIKDKNHIAVYDKHIEEFKSFENLLGSEIIFLALPTPSCGEAGGQDFSAIDDFFRQLNSFSQDSNYHNWKPLVVVKSTVIYGNIYPYLEEHNIIVNPEFLSQNTSFEDSKNQDVVVMGGRIDLLNKLEQFYIECTSLNCSFEFMSIEEAINFKYIRNIYGAYKVLFWNWVQEQTGNARKFADLYSKIPQGEMSQVAADGQLGFGGACFEKDLSARHHEFPHELTEFMQTYNSRLRSKEIAQLNLEVKLLKNSLVKNDQ